MPPLKPCTASGHAVATANTKWIVAEHLHWSV
jgi:hypothetical protein